MTADLFTTATGSDIKVRFCPSPTGTPHVGMARTALFNWAYARHVGGTFVFRIEDTDAERDSEESYAQIVEALRWLHLDWDEGIDVGGPNGPYRQSQRRDIYLDVIERLKAAGYVYESFVTPDEMEARNVAAGRNPKQGYDNFERDLTDEQRAAFRAEGRKPALRLRVPDTDLSFVDLVRGEISFPAGSFTDFVVVRPNGDPLYTLVNPVDDALMGITHVLRGEDLLSSTPRQIALYHALIKIGVTDFIPHFGHLPFVMGEGNKKLSKRDPESNLFLHREHGFIPEGLVNYLALLGWSIGPDRDVFSPAELVEHFDVADVNPNPARFDVKKATAINADHLRALDADDYERRLTAFVQQAGLVGDPLTDREQHILHAAVPLVQPRINLLGESVDMLRFFFVTADQLSYDEDALKQLKGDPASVVGAARAALEALDEAHWTTDDIHQALQTALVDELGVKPRLAFGPIRTLVSGRRVSPPLFESLELLGRAETLSRFDRFEPVLAAHLAETAEA
ncbi:glutamate--tRNA ligase [Pseudoclavibacter soli]|uniref:glutamate--tRNA ligase n=1 Tax=Pseudoclavibacter soli TaxID=452623 RepID=UPI0003F919F5|nr:glutamate--tRNA ligase [Pseudoclavibacter soli]